MFCYMLLVKEEIQKQDEGRYYASDSYHSANILKIVTHHLTLVHPEQPKLWSFVHSECNRVVITKTDLKWNSLVFTVQ